MGNHYGTVRCGVCYERGHNKRSCPALTERHLSRFARYKAELDKEIAAGTPLDRQQYRRMAEREAEIIAKRTGTNPLTGDALVKRGPTRRCSYCKHKHGAWGEQGLGHTRRTCPDLKADMAERVKANAAYRAGMLETLREAGVGVGALISANISGYFDDEEGNPRWGRRQCTTMVREIKWDQINCVDHHEAFIVIQRMDKLGTRDGYQALGAPRRYIVTDEGSTVMVRFHTRDGWGTEGNRVGSWDPAPEEPERHRQHVLATVPGGSINPPAGWETGESAALVEHFKSLKS